MPLKVVASSHKTREGGGGGGGGGVMGRGIRKFFFKL